MNVETVSGERPGILVDRFDNLTVARFFAALLVYMHHTQLVEVPGMPSGFMRNVFANGYNGVTFFFVLSGFVLAHANLDRLRPARPGDWLSFYWKRVARIVPLWLLVSSPYLWYCFLRHDPALPAYLTFTQAWHGDLETAFGVYAVSWTLSVEAFFYLVFPLIAAAIQRFPGPSTGPTLLLVGAGFSGLGAVYFAAHPALAGLSSLDPAGPHHWLYRFPGLRLGDFLMGIGACLVVKGGPAPWGKRGIALLLGGALAGLFVRMAAVPYGETAWWTFPDVVLFALVVLCLAWLDRMGMSVRSRTLILLGEASFAFYLIHGNYMKALLLPALAPIGGLRIAQAMVFILTVSVSVGLLMLVERPAQRFLLWLGRGVSGHGSAARRTQPPSAVLPLARDS